MCINCLGALFYQVEAGEINSLQCALQAHSFHEVAGGIISYSALTACLCMIMYKGIGVIKWNDAI